MFASERDRRSVIEDCRRQYEDDPRAQGVVDTLSRDIIKDGFELSVEGRRAREAQAIADEMLERSGWWDNAEFWIRETLNDGDTFLEVGANDAGDIVQLSRKPTLELHRWTDEFDELVDPTRAFFWTGLWWAGLDPPSDAVYFAEWQMIHARHNRRSNYRYGRPLFASARSPYKRMREGELDIAIRRKTRAGMKYSHVLEDASEGDIDAYRERNKAVLSDPFAAVADFFSNKRASVSAIQGDAKLSEIEDVLHHIRTWWVASPVPMSILGYGQDLNRDVLDGQTKQYERALEQMSEWVTAEFVKPLVERQWLLKGIWPASLTWSAKWSSKQPLTAAGLGEAAKAVTALGASNMLTDETLLKLLSQFIPGFDAQAELKALEQQMRDEVNRVAVNAAGAPADGPQPAEDTQDAGQNQA